MAFSSQRKVLDVRHANNLVGQLIIEDSQYRFEYSASWLAFEAAFPLSPVFPLSTKKYSDSQGSSQVLWYFDNLLPEEHVRKQQAAEAGVSQADTWGLLDYYGLETTGGLSILRPNTVEDKPGLVAIDKEALHDRFCAAECRSLIAEAPKPIAIAGAQPKLPITVFHLFSEPTGAHSSNTILKPDGYSPVYTNTAANEFYCMRLAKAIGMDVARVEFSREIWPTLMVERFDRKKIGGKILRKHVVDGAQLLGVSAHLKYELATATSLLACIEKCHDKERARLSIFSWCVFNILIGNGDAHLKNISFFIQPGTGKISLAPLYDLVSTVIYATPERSTFGPFWPDIKLSMPVGSADRFNLITHEDVVQLGLELGLDVLASRKTIDEVVVKLRRAAEEVYESCNGELSPAERRVISAIIHLPIREMTRRLTRGH